LSYSKFLDSYEIGKLKGLGASKDSEVYECWTKEKWGKRTEIKPKWGKRENKVVQTLRKIPLEEDRRFKLLSNELKLFGHFRHPYLQRKIEAYEDESHCYIHTEGSRGGTLNSQLNEIRKDQLTLKNGQLRLGLITI
jgi:hypothetical protein